jgi:predicted enzyme related to lactoylglutathione lyase
MENTVCLFEIPADDPESLQKFYDEMFGWSFEKFPGAFRYYKIHMDQKIPRGGITARQDATHTPVNYVRVASLAKALEKATGLGAKIVVTRKAIPGKGWYAVLLDPQNNRIGLWEDDTDAK